MTQRKRIKKHLIKKGSISRNAESKEGTKRLASVIWDLRFNEGMRIKGTETDEDFIYTYPDTREDWDKTSKDIIKERLIDYGCVSKNEYKEIDNLSAIIYSLRHHHGMCISGGKVGDDFIYTFPCVENPTVSTLGQVIIEAVKSANGISVDELATLIDKPKKPIKSAINGLWEESKLTIRKTKRGILIYDCE